MSVNSIRQASFVIALLIVIDLFTPKKIYIQIYIEYVRVLFLLFISFASRDGANFHDSIQLAPVASFATSVPRDIGFITLSSDLRSHDGLSSRVTRISAKVIARITHCPPMIEKPAAGGLTVEEAREIDCAGNNAPSDAYSLVKRIYPDRTRNKPGRPDLVRGVAINITHEFIVVRRRVRDWPTVKAVARIARGSLGLLSRYTRSHGSMLLRAQKTSLPHPISPIRRSNPVWQRSDTVLWRGPNVVLSCPSIRWILSGPCSLSFARTYINQEAQQHISVRDATVYLAQS